MGKTIKKIVLTGGPGGGKTTGMCKIPGVLAKFGWKTLLVPEAATETILAGVLPDSMENKYFQTGIVMNQMAKEKVFEHYAKHYPADKVLIICDRGLMDNKAYCDEETFNYALECNGVTEIKARDSYDGVFHLVSPADGAEEFYTVDNNPARSEDVEKARALDRRIKNAWVGHPHMRVIDNNVDSFEDKINWLINEVCSFLGEPTPIEVERSFLIKRPRLEILDKLNAVPVFIYQTYLKSEDGVERRVRVRGEKGQFLYFYTEKAGNDKLSRVEKERRISQEEYTNLLLQADTSLKSILKTRYCFLWNSTYYECDVYPFWDDVAILEVELMTKEQEVQIPPLLTVIKEVTDDSSYKNYSLAKRE